MNRVVYTFSLTFHSRFQVTSYCTLKILVPAERAAQAKSFSVWRMIYFQGTFVLARTFGEFVFLIFRHIITFLLSGVTRVTKMSFAPAKPGSDATTKLAFVFPTCYLVILRKTKKKHYINSLPWAGHSWAPTPLQPPQTKSSALNGWSLFPASQRTWPPK